MSNLLSRKFIGFILITIMLFVLVLVDKITSMEFVAFVTTNLGIYCGSNVIEAVAYKK